ncbi:MAG: response regulator transcription factor [Candidatus Hydrogenedentes bacterium]|nr:response regulator transcription factor [Candidatus Hydrogenedentota bacterium]
MARIVIASTDGPSVAILSAELTAEGHDVAEALDGQDAYGMACDADLMFIDPNLPVFDGLELCAMIRSDPELPAALPLVLLASDAVDARKLESAGASCCFPKIHPAHELRELLAALLGEKARA